MTARYIDLTCTLFINLNLNFLKFTSNCVYISNAVLSFLLTASEEENGGEAPDTSHIIPEDEEAVPGITASCTMQEQGKGCELYSKPVI